MNTIKVELENYFVSKWFTKYKKEITDVLGYEDFEEGVNYTNILMKLLSYEGK